jgi:hypothetical protein
MKTPRSKSIRYKGCKIGDATALDNESTRLVLKKEAKQFYALRRLIRWNDDELIIDVNKPYRQVEAQVLRLAAYEPKEKLTPHTTPETTRRRFLEGETYPHRETLKKIGFKWDPQKSAWWTYDRRKQEAANLLLDYCQQE